MSMTCPECGAKFNPPKAASTVDDIVKGSERGPGMRLKSALRAGDRPNPGVRRPRGQSRYLKGGTHEGLV